MSPTASTLARMPNGATAIENGSLTHPVTTDKRSAAPIEFLYGR